MKIPLPVKADRATSGWWWIIDANGDDLCCFFARHEECKAVAALLNGEASDIPHK